MRTLTDYTVVVDGDLDLLEKEVKKLLEENPRWEPLGGATPIVSPDRLIPTLYMQTFGIFKDTTPQ